MIHHAPQQAQQVTYVQQAPPPGAYGAGVRIQPPQRYILPYKRSHMILGIIQMILGGAAVALSIGGVVLGSRGPLLGSGIYTGIFFFITGVLGLRASQTTTSQARCLITACLVMCIISTLTAFSGIFTAAIERSSLIYYRVARQNSHPDSVYDRKSLRPSTPETVSYQDIKCLAVIVICLIEFVVAIVQAGFGCASCCSCCNPTPVPQNIPPAAVQGQMVASFHPMVAQPAPGYPTQQVPSYPTQQVPSYPAQPPMYPAQQQTGYPPAQPPMHPAQQPPTYAQSPPPYAMAQAAPPLQAQPPYAPGQGAETAHASAPAYPALPSAPPAMDAGPLPSKAY